MIRSTFYAFETAKRALTNSQLGLDTVGHNIANINTLGYTRQRVDQVSFASSGYKMKYQAFATQYAGQGSIVTGINNIRDATLDRRYRTEAADAGKYNAQSSGLAEINKIFDELMSNGSHAKMGEFLDQLDKLIATADSKEQANVLRNKAQQIAQVINTNYQQLVSVRDQQIEELQFAISDINGIIQEIAMLNDRIRECNLYGDPANELNDERNMLIDQLSEFVAIDVKYVPETFPDGSSISKLVINLRDTGNSAKGIEPLNLVDGGKSTGLKMSVDEDTWAVTVHYADPAANQEIKFLHADGTYSSDLTNMLYNGIVKGHLDILNGAGDGVNAYRGIPFYMDCLDDYARTLAQVMNDNNRLMIYGPDGSVGYVERPLFVAEGGGDITAANITVSEQWLSNPQYIETASKNNALYINSSYEICYYDESGTPVSTGVLYTRLFDDTVSPPVCKSTVDKDGFLIDTTTVPPSQILDSAGDPINIDDLQRAVTVNDFSDITMVIKYYADSNDNLVLKSTLTPTDNSSPSGYNWINPATGVADELTIGDIHGIDSDGYLLDIDGNRIQLRDNATNTPLTDFLKLDDLDRQDFSVSIGEEGFLVGDPTPNVLLPGASANDALLTLKDALKSDMTFGSSGFTGNFQEFLVSMQSNMSQDKENADTYLKASITVLSGLANSRDAISAVSIDEEGINMMTYQNYYNAAARYMTVLDEALGTIIQSMGVVGR